LPLPLSHPPITRYSAISMLFLLYLNAHSVTLSVRIILHGILHISIHYPATFYPVLYTHPRERHRLHSFPIETISYIHNRLEGRRISFDSSSDLLAKRHEVCNSTSSRTFRRREIEKFAMEVITVLPILLIIDLFWWLR